MPTELIKVTNVSLDSAFTLARGVCSTAARTDDCADVSYLEDERMLAVTATPLVIARIRALLVEFDRMPETRSFQIIVLSAGNSGSTTANVPESARQALEDVREFLPYTSFDILGSGWLRTSGYGETTLPGPMEFSAELEFRPSTDPTAPILIEQFSIFRHLGAIYNSSGDMARGPEARPVLRTTFTIRPGETVVVGTSKLNGDDTAVVVLLTAVRN